MSHTEQDRKAFYQVVTEDNEEEAIEKWLAENPQIGVLNGKYRKFYKIENNQMILVAKFCK